jgi:hypothetical protein
MLSVNRYFHRFHLSLDKIRTLMKGMFDTEKQVLPGERVGAGGMREVVRKGGRRVNTEQKMCTHACKSKK